MNPLSLHQLASITDGRVINAAPASLGAEAVFSHSVNQNLPIISSLATDSRQLSAGSLFVALKGERFDGHNFVDAAQAAGAAALLVSQQTASPLPQLLVADTRQALGQIAGWWRQQLPVQVLALTGSCGKTTVKEMAAAILRQCGNTLSTEGNFNNEIGVPLTLLRLTAQHQYAVIELGASHCGEIAHTARLAQPQAALVNNLAAAHLQGFGSVQGVAQAKGEIFSALSADGIAIINAESHDLPRWQADIALRRLWRFAVDHQQCQFYASQPVPTATGSQFRLHTPQGEADIHLALSGRHNIANALAATALAMAAGAPLAAVADGLAQVKPIDGRLYPLALAPGQWLIDDSYNANVSSMQAAIAVLAQQPGYRVLVVGDMAELGAQTAICHRQVGETACQAKLDLVLSCGVFSNAISAACHHGEHFTDQASLLVRLRQLLAAHRNISMLIKGSHSSAMYEVVRALRKEALC